MEDSTLLNVMLLDKGMLLDVLLAIILGFAIGFEREITNKWAGLRTHILVCLGSCIFTLLSIHAFPIFAHSPQADPARVAAQVITGIGFIGGGTVLRHGSSIYGLTTAATLWITASIGMACGCGFRTLAVFATVLSVGVLVLVRIFEKEYLHRGPKTPKKVKVNFLCPINSADSTYAKIVSKFPAICEIKTRSATEEDKTKIDFTACVFERNPIKFMHEELKELEGIEAVSMQELYE